MQQNPTHADLVRVLTGAMIGQKPLNVRTTRRMPQEVHKVIAWLDDTIGTEHLSGEAISP